MNATNLHTLARVALVATFFFSQTLLFTEGTGVLVTAAAIVAFATLLILALRLPEGRLPAIFMAVMTLPLIGGALDESLLTLQFALPLFLLGLAGYVWSSAASIGVFAASFSIGLLASVGIDGLGVQDFGSALAGFVASPGNGFCLAAVEGPPLRGAPACPINLSIDSGFIIFLIAFTGLLLVVWAFSPRGKRSSAPTSKSAPARRSAATDPKRGRALVAAAALAASLSLAYSFAAGLAFQGFPGDAAETAMPSFGSLTTSLRTGDGFLLGEGDGARNIASGYSIEKLLLIEANEPCASSGSCSILGVIGVNPNDPSIPIPFLIPADQEDRVVEQLNTAAATYFAMEQDPEMGYGVRERIKSLTADGNYPPVFPTPVRVEGSEAQTLVREAHQLLASTSYQQNFEFLLFLPFLFVALIPFGALRWAWAAYAGRPSLDLLPGTTISTQSYGVTSGIALLLGGTIVGLIAGSMSAAAWTGLAVSSLLAGVTTLVATLYRRHS